MTPACLGQHRFHQIAEREADMCDVVASTALWAKQTDHALRFVGPAAAAAVVFGQISSR